MYNIFKKHRRWRLVCAILSLSLLTVMAGAAVAPALGLIQEHFSNTDKRLVQMIVSMPALFIAGTNLLLFKPLCKRIKARTLLIIGLLLYVVFGCAAGLFDNIVLILICRAMVGVGVGIIMPLSTGLLSFYFTRDKQAPLMGYSSALNMMGGVVATLIAGGLAMISWRMSFLVYLLGLISILLCLKWMPNERIYDDRQKTRPGSQALKYLPYICVMFVLSFTFFVYPASFALECTKSGVIPQSLIAPVKEEFPELVYGHFSGFGLEGEGAGDPGFDTTAFWVRSGAMLDGVVDGDFPYRPSYGFGDIATSGYFLSGMLMALRARDQGMGGSFVSTSLMSAGMWHNIAHLVNSQEKYGREYPLDRYEPWSPTADYYMCKDEKWLCVVGKYYPDDRPVFAELMDMPELMTDPDLASLDKMSASGKTSQVARKIQEKMKEKTSEESSEEWIKIFKERDIPVEPMGHFKDAVYDPQAAANGYVEEFDYGDGEPTKIPVPPMKIYGFDRKPFAQEGKVGAQSAEVLKELGYSDEEIEKFKKEGYID